MGLCIAVVFCGNKEFRDQLTAATQERIFYLPTDALYIILRSIKIHIKIAPTCFGLRPTSGSLPMSLAKVAFIKSVKYAVMDYVVVWHSTHTTMDLCCAHTAPWA
jgi:hypothetical protein